MIKPPLRFYVRYILAVLFITAATAFAIVGTYDIAQRNQLLAFTTYYFVVALFIYWITAILAVFRHDSFSPKQFLNEHRAGLILCVSLAAVMFFAIGPGYRVLSDETNLIAVSKSMYFDKSIYNTTMGKWFYDSFTPINQELPTRPVMYPFFVSLLHCLSGYRYENAFYLNGLFLAALLFTIYVCVVKRLSPLFACALVLLLASQPMLGLSSTSAGFDVMNAFFVVLCAAFAARLSQKTNQQNFLLLWTSLLVMAHIRYENILYIPIYIGILLISRTIDFKFLFTNVAHLGWGVFLLVPRFWQALYSDGKLENGNQDLLALARIPEKLVTFWRSLFTIELRLPYSLAVSAVAIAGVAFFLYQRWQGKVKLTKHERVFVWSLASVNVFYVFITCSHFLAEANHPAVFRLFLMPTLSLSLLAGLGLLSISKWHGAPVAVMAVVCFLYYHPVAILKQMTKTLTLIRTTEEIYRFIDRLPDKRFLLVIDRPGQYTIRDIGAVSHDYANRNIDELLFNLNRSLFGKIYVVQEVEYSSKKAKHPVDTRYDLVPVYRFQHDAVSEIVIFEASANYHATESKKI